MVKSFFIEHSYRNGTCPIFKTHDTTHYPDKFADREILELKAICINKENGCNWSNSLRHLEVKILILTYFVLMFNHNQSQRSILKTFQ